MPKQDSQAEIENPLRVVFVTRKWRPAIGGMEIYCHELSERLDARIDLTLRTLAGRDGGKPPSFFALMLFGVRNFFFLSLWARRFDVVHIADLALWPLAAAAAVAAPKTRIVATAHGSDIAYPQRPGLRPKLYRLYLKLAGALIPRLCVIANSRATAELCRQNAFRVGGVVPLGAAQIAKPAEIHPPENFVLFVGRLVPGKGCAWFIDQVLPKLRPDIRLAIAGVKWDRGESEALRAERVEFLGPIYGEGLTALRQRAIAVVVPNISAGGRYFEGFGLAALEAGASGGISIAARIGGIDDAVIDGTTGILLPAESAQVWADKIHEVADWPPERRRAFIAGALAAIEQAYSWERVVEDTLRIYRRDPRLDSDAG